MKKILATVAVLLLVSVLFLAGCQEEAKPDYFELSKDGSTNYVIVNLLSDKSAANDLAKNLKLKGSTTFSVADKPASGKNAIYIGTVEQLASFGLPETELNYTAFQIAVSDNNIYVALTDEQFAKEVITRMKDYLVKVSDGQVSLDKSWLGNHDVAKISEVIPAFVTAKGKLYDVHDSGNGNFLLTYQNVPNLNEPITYEYTLIDAGYTLVQANEIGSNRFVTYIKGDTMIHCTYFAASKEYRIVYGPKTYLGDMQPVTNYEKKVTPSVSMLEVSGTGMSMVVQLADGSFIVIDGGHGQSITEIQKQEDMERLLNFLTSNTPGGGKPQITWMITHPDPDHIDLPIDFIDKYADKINVTTVCYNFPNMENIGLSSSNNPATYTSYINGFIGVVNKNFPNANHYITHTGNKLYLPGCEIEFLFNPSEDFYPAAMSSCNHTSIVWRMTIEGKTILITGDIETGLSNKLANNYGNYLASNVLQVIHHGVNGGTTSFNSAAASGTAANGNELAVCFWPIRSDRIWRTEEYASINKPLWDSDAVDYYLSETTTILLPSLQVKK